MSPATAPPENKLSPRRRDRRGTEAKLRAAVEDLIVEAGFGALSAAAVAKRAGVDKMLIYRYFGDLKGLVRSIAFADDFFPSFDMLLGELTAEQLLAMPISQRTAHVIGRNARLLMERPVVLELMAWELIERNELTAIMEEAREELGLRLMRDLFGDVADKAVLRAFSALHSASVTYLLLRRRKIRWYVGVDLKSDDDWDELIRAIETMTQGLDHAAPRGR